MDGGGVTVEELDRALLELLEHCSEPAGVTAQEKADLHQEKADLQKGQRDQCGDCPVTPLLRCDPPIFCHRSRFVDFPDVPVRLSGGTLGGGGGCLGGGLGAQASVTSFPTTLEPWQVLQLFVVGDFWTCSCHARGAPSGGKMSISHGCGGLLRALGHEKLPWRVVL